MDVTVHQPVRRHIERALDAFDQRRRSQAGMAFFQPIAVGGADPRRRPSRSRRIRPVRSWARLTYR